MRAPMQYAPHVAPDQGLGPVPLWQFQLQDALYPLLRCAGHQSAKNRDCGISDGLGSADQPGTASGDGDESLPQPDSDGLKDLERELKELREREEVVIELM